MCSIKRDQLAESEYNFHFHVVMFFRVESPETIEPLCFQKHGMSLLQVHFKGVHRDGPNQTVALKRALNLFGTSSGHRGWR